MSGGQTGLPKSLAAGNVPPSCYQFEPPILLLRKISLLDASHVAIVLPSIAHMSLKDYTISAEHQRKRLVPRPGCIGLQCDCCIEDTMSCCSAARFLPKLIVIGFALTI